jgi:hypothetical protein
VSAGVIHPEIWQDIRTADLVIADITGRNGNVMLELGVASAWLDKERVIIIREDDPGEGWLFDINPARQIAYTRSPSGFASLMSRLAMLIQDLLPAPRSCSRWRLVRPFRLRLICRLGTIPRCCGGCPGPTGEHCEAWDLSSVLSIIFGTDGFQLVILLRAMFVLRESFVFPRRYPIRRIRHGWA